MSIGSGVERVSQRGKRKSEGEEDLEKMFSVSSVTLRALRVRSVFCDIRTAEISKHLKGRAGAPMKWTLASFPVLRRKEAI